jgi:hypothetical protein
MTPNTHSTILRALLLSHTVKSQQRASINLQSMSVVPLTALGRPICSAERPVCNTNHNSKFFRGIAIVILDD